MRLRRSAVLALLGLASATAATPSSAQLRPNRESLQVAEQMKSRGATAADVAKDLSGRRQDAAAITAVLHAVGYRPADIGKAHAEALRLTPDASAAATMRAVGDAALAYDILSSVARTSVEAASVARTRLRLSAGDVLRQRRQTAKVRVGRLTTERAYLELSRAGYLPDELVAALTESLESTPEEIFDAMRAAGAGYTEIAQHLQDDLGWTRQQVADLFRARAVPLADGAEALQAIGADGEEIVTWVLGEVIAGAQVGSDRYTEFAVALSGRFDTVGEVVEALSGAGIPAPVVATVSVAVVAVRIGSLTSAAAVDAVSEVVAAMAGAGISIADLAGDLYAAGVSGELIASALVGTQGSVTVAWEGLRDGLGWTTQQIEAALGSAIPVTIASLAELVGLGATPGKIRDIVEALRDKGVSAIAIAAEVGEELGIVPMATALWGAGYGAAEVTQGLVQGMQASASEAAQVVSGLVGGGS